MFISWIPYIVSMFEGHMWTEHCWSCDILNKDLSCHWGSSVLWCPICRVNSSAWWRHQMETFSALLALCAGNSPVSGEFPAQRPVTRSFDVLCPLWRHGNVGKLIYVLQDQRLTRWGLNNMAPIINISKCVLTNENGCILFQISPKLVLKDPIDNMSELN